MTNESDELTLHREQLNDILIDVAMYEDADLVQEVLDVTVAHYSKRSILLENARSVQLLVSQKRERQFRQIDIMLRDLESNAETQELWGNLLTEDDKTKSKQTHDILGELLYSVRSRREVLEFDEEFSPEKDVQDLLRNLGFFEIAWKVFDLVGTSINTLFWISFLPVFFFARHVNPKLLIIFLDRNTRRRRRNGRTRRNQQKHKRNCEEVQRAYVLVSPR